MAEPSLSGTHGSLQAALFSLGAPNGGTNGGVIVSGLEHNESNARLMAELEIDFLKNVETTKTGNQSQFPAMGTGKFAKLLEAVRSSEKSKKEQM